MNKLKRLFPKRLNERFRKYCENNNISVNKVIYEDYSPKSFDCPEWKKYLIEVRKRSNKSNLVFSLEICSAND